MENAPINSLIYQAVYILVFITATTVTINLFQKINDYVDTVTNSVYLESYSDVVSENDAFKDEFENMEYTLQGYEVFSLVNNYGMYIGSQYQYGKKYNGGVQNLKYKVSVYNKENVLYTDINSIDLTSKYTITRLEENFIEIKEK